MPVNLRNDSAAFSEYLTVLEQIVNAGKPPQ